MSAQNPYSNYVNNAISTASKEKLTLMLYDGALKFSNQAIMALEEKDYIKLNETIKRAMDILKELQITLDRRYEITGNLFALYDYVGECLLRANVDRDRDALEEARGFLRELRDVWKQAMSLVQ